MVIPGIGSARRICQRAWGELRCSDPSAIHSRALSFAAECPTVCWKAGILPEQAKFRIGGFNGALATRSEPGASAAELDADLPNAVCESPVPMNWSIAAPLARGLAQGEKTAKADQCRIRVGYHGGGYFLEIR